MHERLHLIEAIEQALGHALAPPLGQAFLTVPRAHFVPCYYVQEQPGNWRKYETASVVYQDKALVTKLNAQQHPCSSSSQPSIMAAMLEALDVRPGQRVLEIGTGTGYNAALLGCLVGNQGQVVSIDSDRELVHLAQERLSAMGVEHVTTYTHNGLQGYEPDAPYDRIIVTAAYLRIPRVWLAQLAVGGVLVGNLHRSLATPLFRLVKQADGTAAGTLLSTPAFFMTLTAPEEDAPKSPGHVTRAERLPCAEKSQIHRDEVNALYDPSFGLFLESALPGIERHLHYLGGSPNNIATCFLWKETLLTLAPLDQKQGMTSEQWAVEVRGEVPLWSQIQSLYSAWRGQGKPSVIRYAFTVTPEGDARLSFLDEKRTEGEKQ